LEAVEEGQGVGRAAREPRDDRAAADGPHLHRAVLLHRLPEGDLAVPGDDRASVARHREDRRHLAAPGAAGSAGPPGAAQGGPAGPAAPTLSGSGSRGAAAVASKTRIFFAAISPLSRDISASSRSASAFAFA